MTAEEVIKLLKLEPHPLEGGFFQVTYRSADILPTSALPERYHGPRALGSAIYYLLTPETCSRLHRLPTDEIFHFYLGDPVSMLLLMPDGTSDILTLGHNIAHGQTVQTLVPRNCWQGAKLQDGGTFALMGTTLCPGFDYDDYEQGDPDELIALYPKQKNWIETLTQAPV